jgi:hypothetical protein
LGINGQKKTTNTIINKENGNRKIDTKDRLVKRDHILRQVSNKYHKIFSHDTETKNFIKAKKFFILLLPLFYVKVLYLGITFICKMQLIIIIII